MPNLDLSAEKYAMLSHEQEKGVRNLEFALVEPIIQLASTLGLTESSQMIQIREAFYTKKPETLQEIQTFCATYFDLLQTQADKSQGENPRLAYNMLTAVLYLPRQTADVQEFFIEACNDAILHASQINDDLADTLADLLERIHV